MIVRYFQRIYYILMGAYVRLKLIPSVSKGEQLLLAQRYRSMKDEDGAKEFSKAGFQVYSGDDEDGLLLYIYSIIGVETKIIVDIGASSLNGSNSANLIINHGWNGMLIDASASSMKNSSRMYSSFPSTRIYPPKTCVSFVTKENVNSLLKNNGIEGSIDMLSIDIDGNDYWIWEVLDIINPRLVIIEYQTALGPEESLSVPYEKEFNRDAYDVNKNSREIVYCGASLNAFNKLATKKGYHLIGTNRLEFNAFFLRDDLADPRLSKVDVNSCFNHARSKELVKNYFGKIADMPWKKI